jgi:hypothetical protein
MERWKLLEPGEALEVVSYSIGNGLADGIIVSSPADFKGGLRFVEELRKRL